MLTKFHTTPHIIFANLPYIDKDEMHGLQKEIRYAEPSNALNGGKDGLAIIIKLLKQLSEIINPKLFRIILEIGINHDAQIKRIVKEFIPNSNLSFRKLTMRHCIATLSRQCLHCRLAWNMYIDISLSIYI